MTVHVINPASDVAVDTDTILNKIADAAVVDGDTIRCTAGNWILGKPSGWARATGTITCVAAASINDGETVSIPTLFLISPDVWQGPVVRVFEFRKTGTVTPGNYLVDISGATTAAEVATALATAIEAFTWTGSGHVRTSTAAEVITVTQRVAGADGNLSLTETVSDAGFTVAGFSGGTTGTEVNISSPVGTWALYASKRRLPWFGTEATQIVVNKAITLEGDVDGSGNPTTKFLHDTGTYPPVLIDKKSSIFGPGLVPTVPTNGVSIFLAASDHSTGYKAGIKNIEISGSDPASPVGVHAVSATAPFDMENVVVKDGYSHVLECHSMPPESVYPNLGDHFNPDFSNPLLSTIKEVSMTNGLVFMHEAASGMQFENCKHISSHSNGWSVTRPHQVSLLFFGDFWDFSGWEVHGVPIFSVRFLRDSLVSGGEWDGTNNEDIGGGYRQEMTSAVNVVAVLPNTFTEIRVRDCVAKKTNLTQPLWFQGIFHCIGAWWGEAKAWFLNNQTEDVSTQQQITMAGVGIDGRAAGSYIVGNKFTNAYDAADPKSAISTIGLVLDSTITSNDYTPSGHPSLQADDDGNKACIFLGEDTADNTVHEPASNFPNPGGVKQHVKDLSDGANMLPGYPANNTTKPPGIGQKLKAAAEAAHDTFQSTKAFWQQNQAQ